MSKPWKVGDSGLSKIKEAVPTPTKPTFRTQTETRRGTQTREFQTLAGGSQRSKSVSRREEQRTLTINNETNKVTNTGSWVHIGDTNRQHTHPGGSPHTPTSAAGAVSGSSSTPAERLALDTMATTTRASSTVWD